MGAPIPTNVEADNKIDSVKTVNTETRDVDELQLEKEAAASHLSTDGNRDTIDGSDEKLDATDMNLNEHINFPVDEIFINGSCSNGEDGELSDNHARTETVTVNEVKTENEIKVGDKTNILMPPPTLPKYNKRALPKDATTYMLETFTKNIMIIFNHEFVDLYEQRKGTHEDVKALKSTFSQFGFEISIHTDKLRKEIGELMLQFSQKDFTHYGCVAIAVLTHGSERGGLRAKDKKYREQQILKLLKENPTLATKPIIYIIQACRGTRLTSTYDVYTKVDNKQFSELYKLPMEADTLVLHSTYEGYFSFRNENTGSWFIQTLCSKINELAETEDLESIMTVVKRTIAIEKDSSVLNSKTNRYDFNKQMPVTESTLIRKLYLQRSSVVVESSEICTISSFVKNDSIMQKTETILPYRNAKPYLEESSTICQSCTLIGLERFDYAIRCLEYYINENSNDAKAKRLMILAKPYLNNGEANEAKIEIAKDIRDHLKKKATDFNSYKYLYIWNDLEYL